MSVDLDDNDDESEESEQEKQNEDVALGLESLGQDGANNIKSLLDVGNGVVALNQGLDLTNDIVAERALHC